MKIICLFFVFITPLFCNLNVLALEKNLPSYDLISEEEFDHYEITYFNDEPKDKLLIEQFDVNENGDYAIASRDYSKDIIGSLKKEAFWTQICVYSSKSEFKYGYRLRIGKGFVVQLHEDSVSVFFEDTGKGVTYDSNGNFVNAISFDEDKNDPSTINCFFSELSNNERHINNIEYRVSDDKLSLDLFVDSKTELTMKNENGYRVVLYEADSEYVSRYNAFYIGMLACLALSLIAVLITIVRSIVTNR